MPHLEPCCHLDELDGTAVVIIEVMCVLSAVVEHSCEVVFMGDWHD